jgi:hypothetical protein
MSGNGDLINRLKGELRSFGAISDKGLALFTMRGEILFSDLSSDVEKRLMLFKPSFPGLTIGSNITLAAENESVIVMRTSEKMLMAVQTQQRVGLTLVMLSSLIKRYANEFDTYVKPEVTKTPEVAPKVETKEITPRAVTEIPAAEKVGVTETVKEVEKELTKEQLEGYQKSLIYELIPPLTPDNVLDKSSVWNRAARLMLRNLDQDLTVDELREGLHNAGFNVSWQWVNETLHALETRGTVRIKGKKEQ